MSGTTALKAQIYFHIMALVIIKVVRKNLNIFDSVVNSRLEGIAGQYVQKARDTFTK